MNLEGLTRRQVGYLMAVMTLAVPFGIFWQGSSGGSVETAIYSLIWVIRLHDGQFFAFHIFDIFYTFTAVSTGFVSIFFAVQIVRCFKSDASRRMAYILGVLTLYLPTGFGVSMMLTALERYGVLLYMGPIPVQLVIGILLLRKTKHVVVTNPWMEKKENVLDSQE